MPQPRNFRVRGLASTIAAPPTRDPALAITDAHRLRAATGARSAELAVAEIPADAVVRLEFENGLVLWSRADDLIREHGRRSLGRDGSESWLIEPRARTGTQRGALGLGLRLLEYFGVELGRIAVRTLAEAFENRSLEAAGPGLYRCPLAQDGPALAQLAEDQRIASEGGPALVLLHGTGSSTRGSFGKLWAPGNVAGALARRRLHERYGERVFALEHRSLTESPIENALQLASRLAPDCEVHLLSHSRGGLVGELLCLGMRERNPDPLDPSLIEALFAADRTMAEQLGLGPLEPSAAEARERAYAEDRQRLSALRELLDERHPRVTRFVRVACPARGTTLASGRLDRWLSMLDFVAGSTLFGDAVDLIMAVVKQRTDPRSLPGLEAMMPGSALVRLLQHPDLLTSADLSAIAGDIAGDSAWSRIKLLVADWFYGADHDLVVNTGSMSGGLRRPPGGARLLLDRGPEVSHFRYFENQRSIKWLLAGLNRSEDADGGFRPITAAPAQPPRWREAVRRSRAGSTPKPLAVVLPGTMGSVLQAAGETVWLNYWRLARGGLGRIALGEPDIEPVDLVDAFYGPLLEFLAGTHRVEIFPYDWRHSVCEAAARLAETLTPLVAAAERERQPVHLVAHSMGGLVVRSMIADGGAGAALWARITALPDSRLLMLGTPNLGSHEALRWLTGGNPTQLKLALLDLTRSVEGIIEIVREYPGLLELLPFDPDGEDFADPALWRRLRAELEALWREPPAQALRAARATWERLRATPPDARHMIYVAGCQPATVTGYRTEPRDELFAGGTRKLVFEATARGDGTVTWASGRLPGVPTYYLEDTAHDALCAQPRAFAGYLELLLGGTTQRLAASPPARGRAAGDEQGEDAGAARRPFADALPDEHEVLRFGFGDVLAPLEEQRETRPPIRLSVRHDDLSYARFPVLVGHYAGDTIVSAEAALDTRLDHALSTRMRVGLYPSTLGSHALFINADPDGQPGGAIVVGLGQIGQISPGLLQNTLRDALLEYALHVAQSDDLRRFGPADRLRSARVSALLVGSGAGGIPVTASVEALLEACLEANALLADQGLGERVRIDELELIELFADIAIAAADALTGQLARAAMGGRIAWDGRIRRGEGAQRRLRFDEQPPWWHRLEIRHETLMHEGEVRDALRFVFATDRARAEETLVAGQLDLVDTFIRQACASPASNQEVAKTLFEMLLPNRGKELAPQQSSLVLLLDERSAAYPWELLEDRWSDSGRPPAVAGGLVRQLKSGIFRARPTHSPQPKALVVGHPDLAGWPAFDELPGARREAEQVAAQLRASGFTVHDSIDEGADQILSALHRDAWRILHLAGHGEHRYPIRRPDGSTREVSGMVIGRESFLTPGDVEQMRWVPELVFINCCHLGRTLDRAQRRFAELAANLSVQFIRMGVRAVIAAGWAVDDQAASTFATACYRLLLNGECFGEAVRGAREEVWLRCAGVNTWGAYQCYGDPGYRLHGEGARPPARAPRSYVAHEELVTALDNLAARIRMESRRHEHDPGSRPGMRAAIERELACVPDALREEWLARADVAAALGFAWAEAGAYAEAIEWLERALHAGAGDCPIRALEQSANLRVRHAGEQWLQLADQTERDISAQRRLGEEIRAAIGELDAICQRAPSAERLSLLGSACKRLAWIADAPAQRLEALINMANYYRLAIERGTLAGRPADPYPFANHAVARALAGWYGGEPPPPELAAGCEAMIETAAARNDAEPNFWNTVAAADCALARLLVAPPRGGALQRAGAAIAARYRQGFARGASPRQRASVLEHLDFVLALATPAPRPLRNALCALRSELGE